MFVTDLICKLHFAAYHSIMEEKRTEFFWMENVSESVCDETEVPRMTVERTAAEEKAIGRLYGLLDLQKELERKFGSDHYNIFIFGSYITVYYIEGMSDIDVAIYTDNFELYKKISLYLEEYFETKGIRSDIFYIDLNMPAPVYLAALNSKVQFTDFYPPCLEAFKRRCQQALNKMKLGMMS